MYAAWEQTSYRSAAFASRCWPKIGNPYCSWPTTRRDSQFHRLGHVLRVSPIIMRRFSGNFYSLIMQVYFTVTTYTHFGLWSASELITFMRRWIRSYMILTPLYASVTHSCSSFSGSYVLWVPSFSYVPRLLCPNCTDLMIRFACAFPYGNTKQAAISVHLSSKSWVDELFRWDDTGQGPDHPPALHIYLGWPSPAVPYLPDNSTVVQQKRRK